MTCVTSKVSDQPVNPPSTARVLVHLSLDSPEAVEGAFDQQLLRSRLRGRTCLIVDFVVRLLNFNFFEIIVPIISYTAKT